MGSGFGLSVPLVNHMTEECSSPAKRGQSLAYLSMALFLGQFLSSAMEFVPGGFGPVFSVASMGAAAIAITFGIGFRADRKTKEQFDIARES